MRTIESLKRRAKEIRKDAPGLSHNQALEQAAKAEGFSILWRVPIGRR